MEFNTSFIYLKVNQSCGQNFTEDLITSDNAHRHESPKCIKSFLKQ